MSCVAKLPKAQQKEVLKLSKLLQSLDSKILQYEATKLSGALFAQVAVLSHAFKMTSPAKYHNFLVNVGVRDKGLCYHWSDALYAHFIQEEYPSFEFHLMGTNIGEYWSEHNSLVVSARGKKIQDGVVIDAWRHAGILYFSKVKEDTRYYWKHRADRGCNR